MQSHTHTHTHTHTHSLTISINRTLTRSLAHLAHHSLAHHRLLTRVLLNRLLALAHSVVHSLAHHPAHLLGHVRSRLLSLTIGQCFAHAPTHTLSHAGITGSTVHRSPNRCTFGLQTHTLVSADFACVFRATRKRILSPALTYALSHSRAYNLHARTHSLPFLPARFAISDNAMQFGINTRTCRAAVRTNWIAGNPGTAFQNNYLDFLRYGDSCLH